MTFMPSNFKEKVTNPRALMPDDALRVCKTCGVEKKAIHFHKSDRNVGGRRPVCADCINKHILEREEKKVGHITQVCLTCQIEKPLKAFTRDSKRNINSSCKQCKKEGRQLLPDIPAAAMHHVFPDDAYTVYLAGRIAGLTPYEARSWRVTVAENMRQVGIKTLDPMRGKTYLTEGVAIKNSAGDPADIFDRDMNDIYSADCVFANLAAGTAFGTPVELGYAHGLDKDIVIFSPDEDMLLHPFVLGISTYATSSYTHATMACKVLAYLKRYNVPGEVKLKRSDLPDLIERAIEITDKDLADYLTNMLMMSVPKDTPLGIGHDIH